MWSNKVESKGEGWEESLEQDAGGASSPTGDPAQGVNAFVGKGVHFKGTISYNGTVRIDGHMEGEIHTEGTLLVGEEAVINATVSAGTIICKGKITGDIQAREKVKLRAPAVLNGSVIAPMLSIEEGVLFNGSCEMTKAGAAEQRETILQAVGAQTSGLQRSAG